MILSSPKEVENPQKLVEELFRNVQWEDGDHGFIECPGIALHSGKNNKKDCKIIIKGPPTIHCFHTSCKDAVDAANLTLRRAMAGVTITPTGIIFRETMDRGAVRAMMAKKEEVAKLERWAVTNKASLLQKHAWPHADAFHESPMVLGECDDFPLFLSLFNENDTIWIGEPLDSGPHAAWNFRTVKEWRALTDPVHHFTCPSIFTPGVYSRSNANVVLTRYLVVESDTLKPDEMLALANWMRTFMRLRAVIDTGGRSLHCWFDFPSPELYEKLKIVLPQLGCDPALFKPSQPVRVPGVMRGERWQQLVYFDNCCDIR